MNGLGNEPLSEVKTKKHESLFQEIIGIDGLYNHAESLLMRIKGEAKPISPEDKAKPEAPSLEKLLADGPADVSNRCSAVHKILDQIQEALF